MGNIVSIGSWGKKQPADLPEQLTKGEVFLLLHQIRATARAINKPRDLLFVNILARENVDELEHLDRSRLEGLVEYLHQEIIRHIANGQRVP